MLKYSQKNNSELGKYTVLSEVLIIWSHFKSLETTY